MLLRFACAFARVNPTPAANARRVAPTNPVMRIAAQSEGRHVVQSSLFCTLSERQYEYIKTPSHPTRRQILRSRHMRRSSVLVRRSPCMAPTEIYAAPSSLVRIFCRGSRVVRVRGTKLWTKSAGFESSCRPPPIADSGSHPRKTIW